MDYKKLIRFAFAAAEKSYSPYSRFKVGAAVLSKDGRVFTGANIENASYSVTNCAERVALQNAVFEGAREFEAVAVVGFKEGETADFCPPCGGCRQAFSEFSKDGSLKIVLAKSEDDFKVYTLNELMPETFGTRRIVL